MFRKLRRFLRRKLLSILADDTGNLEPRMSTSLSDNQVYPQACLDAVNDYKAFNEFRSNKQYQRILEHTTMEEAQKALEEIPKDPDIMSRMDRFRENDEWGGAQPVEFPGIGAITTSTLRYVKVLADLKRSFGNLDGLDICEIGVGYGGQCRIINAMYKPATYRLVDIQPALALAQRYLGNYVLHSTLSFLTMNELAGRNYDLAISNYAFTELPRALQDIYLERVILNAPRGYMNYNEITPESYHSYKAEELVELIPDARISSRGEFQNPESCLIIWGADR